LDICNIGIGIVGIGIVGICNMRTTTAGFRLRRSPGTGNHRTLCQKTVG
jgi:hypothetical protein